MALDRGRMQCEGKNVSGMKEQGQILDVDDFVLNYCAKSGQQRIMVDPKANSSWQRKEVTCLQRKPVQQRSPEQPQRPLKATTTSATYVDYL
jgi:hypothetical protein